MTDLQECRRQIDEIDSEILRLFEKRMKVSEDVANYKIRTGKPVFDAVREREKLKSLGEQAHGEFNACLLYTSTFDELFDIPEF